MRAGAKSDPFFIAASFYNPPNLFLPPPLTFTLPAIPSFTLVMIPQPLIGFCAVLSLNY